MKYQPPKNVKNLIQEAYIICCMCSKSLLEKSYTVYKCKETGQFICKDCKTEFKEANESMKVTKFKDFEHPEDDDQAEKAKK